eukprot:1086243-Rhodomonas_salina.1
MMRRAFPTEPARPRPRQLPPPHQQRLKRYTSLAACDESLRGSIAGKDWGRPIGVRRRSESMASAKRANPRPDFIVSIPAC